MAGSGNEPVAGARLEIGADEKKLEKGLDAATSTVAQFTKESSRAFGQMSARIQGYVDKIDARAATERLQVLEQAVARLGGVSNLTAPQLERVQAELKKLAEQGGRVPASLQAINKETDKLAAAAKAAASGGGLSGILGAISPAAAAAAAGVAGLAAGVTVGVRAIARAVVETATYAANLKNLSESYNINIVALQRLKAAAESADVPLETVAKASSNITKALVETPDKVRALGLSVDELMAMSPDRQFFAVAEAIKAIENPTLQSAAALDLLGKTGPEVLRLLKTDMRAAADEAQRMGRIMDEDVAQASAELKQELGTLDKAWEGFKANAASIVTGNRDTARSVRVLTETFGILSLAIQKSQGILAKGWPEAGFINELVARMAAASAALRVETARITAQYPGATPKEIQDMLAASDVYLRKLREDDKRLVEALKRSRKEYTDFLRDQLSKEEQAIREAYDREIAADTKYRDFIKEQLSREEQAVRESQEREVAAVQAGRDKSAEAVLAAEQALATARARGSDDVQAAFAKIDAARDRAIDKILREKEVTQEAKEATVALYQDAAEEEKRYAAQQLAKQKHQDLLDDLDQITEGFGELINIFDQLGIKADSGLGKAARAGEQLASSAKNFAVAGAAFAQGDYLTAAVEGLKGVGQVIGAMKTLFSEPSWKKVGREAGRVLGMEISEELAKTIEKTAKELKISVEAASLLNLSKAIQASRRDAREFGVQIGQLMTGIVNGSIPAKEGVKELGTVFNEVREAAAAAGTVGDKTLTSILKLARELGGAAYTDEMRAFTGEKLDASAEFLNQWIEAFAKLKGLAPETMSKLGAQGAEMFMLNFQSVAAERGKLVAVAMFGDDFEALKEKLKAGGNEAALALLEPFQRWQSYVTDETLGPLLQMSEATRGMLVNQADAGYLNVDAFRTMQESGALLFDSLIEKGMALPDALEAVAPTIQAAISAAEQFGVPLDDDMERLKALAEQNGYTFQTGPMERMVDILTAIAVKLGADLPAALDRSAAAAEGFGTRTNQVFDETAAGAETMTDDIVRSWDEGTGIVELLTTEMGKEVGQEITAMADAAETVFGYMTDDLEGSLSEWPGIADGAKDKVAEIISRLPSGISIPINFPITEPDGSRFPGGGAGGGGEPPPYQFGGIEDFGRESIVAVHGREAIVPEGSGWFIDMLRQAVREGGAAGTRRGDIYLLVDTRGSVQRLSRAEFRQVESALAGGVIRVPQRVLSDRIG